MFFNLDREKKQRILNYYKNSALDSRKKKEAAKKLRIQEELNYLHLKEKEELETENKIKQEESRKKKALMDEYLQMLQKTHNDIPGFHFIPKNKDVIINNWGKTKEETLLANKNSNIYNNIKSRNSVSVDYEKDNFNSLSQEEKAKEIIKPIDSMNKLHPFYLVYIKEDGEILSNHLNVKNTLDLLRIMSKGKNEPDKTAYNIFNEFTNDGRDMKVYSELLSQSIESIINIKEENDIDSLFRSGGTTMLKNDIKGLEDFELITFMVVI